MVTVLMCDDDTVELIGHGTQLGNSLGDASQTNPGIYQQTTTLNLYECGIATAP
jgi:hypothetical protein